MLSQQQLLSLEGQLALVTGAGQGLGAAIARRLAAAGATVVVHYRRQRDRAEQVVKKIEADGGSALAMSADLSDPAAVKAMFDALPEDRGPLAVLVNNVGSYPLASFMELDVQAWRTLLADNLETSLLCAQQAARRMQNRGGGAIVNIASIAGLSPGPAHSHYNSAKAALLMLTRSMAQELGPSGIRVNAVSPGLIHREGIEDDWPEGVQRWQSKAPLQRLGQPEDIADACLFLASPAARWISGHNLVVDGGMLSSPIY